KGSANGLGWPSKIQPCGGARRPGPTRVARTRRVQRSCCVARAVEPLAQGHPGRAGKYVRLGLDRRRNTGRRLAAAPGQQQQGGGLAQSTESGQEQSARRVSVVGTTLAPAALVGSLAGPSGGTSAARVDALPHDAGQAADSTEESRPRRAASAWPLPRVFRFVRC